MYGIVPAFDDAMFFASAGVWARQRSNALGDLQAPDAAHLDATTATSTFICGNYRHPFGFHHHNRPC
jgi:hypothetical protein